MFPWKRHSYSGLVTRDNDVITNDQPIIAVLAQPLPGNNDMGASFIPASYVKDVESGGARVVPIPTRFDISEVSELFRYVNGLLIPGGASDVTSSKYFENAKLLFRLAIEANQKGDYFPIWGTCLGCEALMVIVSGTSDILTPYDATDIALPLQFSPDVVCSRLFRDMDPTLFSAIETENVTYNYHKLGIKPELFESNKLLKAFFTVLSTNSDKYCNRFVSTIEGRYFPFYGVMWHPEKPPYEHKRMKQKRIPHTLNAIKISQHISSFFVNECRRSKHSFPSQEMEERYLIYRYASVRPSDEYPSLRNIYEQIYIFD